MLPPPPIKLSRHEIEQASKLRVQSTKVQHINKNQEPTPRDNDELREDNASERVVKEIRNIQSNQDRREEYMDLSQGTFDNEVNFPEDFVDEIRAEMAKGTT